MHYYAVRTLSVLFLHPASPYLKKLHDVAARVTYCMYSVQRASAKKRQALSAFGFRHTFGTITLLPGKRYVPDRSKLGRMRVLQSCETVASCETRDCFTDRSSTRYYDTQHSMISIILFSCCASLISLVFNTVQKNHNPSWLPGEERDGRVEGQIDERVESSFEYAPSVTTNNSNNKATK